jgi:hypothetical protein
MAVVTLDKRRQTSQTINLKRRGPQIFVAHCQISNKLLEDIKNVIEREKVVPFIAQEQFVGKQTDSVVQAIKGSDAFFGILTKRAFSNHSVRDWILFETGIAKALWMNVSLDSYKYRTFFWKDVSLKLSESPITSITDFKSFNLKSKNMKDIMLDEMRTIAYNISILNMMN